MAEFLSGALMISYAVSGLFFLKFWKQSKDPLFISFAIAFWLLSLERFPLLFVDRFQETRSYINILRLIAFSLIIGAIFYKNRRLK